ncbi:phosphodiester glycosidase family protein [candidate division WWE3 bacterium]|uniref:Phosphodiester glycosidase family protein n=1 Tax=candidate division WWE3 bacterium TaxID=2053526 RepID=A0A955LKL9_UNCKA|nr:phosphodiester glycosidase family protein [candidate division WWE3 bacterium]
MIKTAQAPLLRMVMLLVLVSTFGVLVVFLLRLIGMRETQVQENITTQVQTAKEAQDALTQLSTDYEDVLYEQQIKDSQQKALQEAKDQIEAEYERLKSEESTAKLLRIEAIYSDYQLALQKVARNAGVQLDTADADSIIATWGTSFLNEEYDELETSIAQTKESLDSQYQTYLATLPTPTPVPTSPPAQPAVGYSYQSVSTSKGTFGVYLVKLSRSQYTMKTITANTNDCTNNCPAKTLADYVSSNNAYAGINGSYFCPPDYASCSGKTYSFDSAMYNSNLGKWINASHLTWNGLGMVTANGATLKYYQPSTSYDNSSVTAGIVNFPSLLHGGTIVGDTGNLAAYQTQVKGTRGFIGSNDTDFFFGHVSGATVLDVAYVLKALGATNALNLDGGGSSALYVGGSYKVGPGRLLPNAVVFVRN